MPYKANHHKLGEVEVLIEAEINHANALGSTDRTVSGVKYFALIKSSLKPIKERFDYSVRWKNGSKIVKHYYVLWGNTPDFSQMGITHLLTPKLNTFKSTTTPTNLFFEMIKSSEFMNFINKK